MMPTLATGEATGAARRFSLRLFSQELALLLGAGIALLEAIVTLQEKEADVHAARVLGSLAAALTQGQPLSAALAAQPQNFDAVFLAVVAAAERSGQLRTALQAHASYLVWLQDLRAKLLAASLYPLLLLLAGGAVLLFLLVFVVPRFAGLLEGTGAQLPLASALLIELGRWTGQHRLLTLLGGGLLMAAPAWAWQQPDWRAWLVRQLWRVPLLGEKLRLLALARIYRTASMLLDAGVPLVAALHNTLAVAEASQRSALQRALNQVSEGERLSVAMQAAGLTTPVSLRMLRVGERTGDLGAMLGRAAAFHDEELAHLSELVTRLINPLLMLLMGGVIGTVIVLMYLPIFQLVEQVQ